MATFTNKATLSFTGGSVDSNTVTGTLLETLAVTKTALTATYREGTRITYAVSLVNSGSTGFTGLTLSDDLGGYPVGGTTVYPLILEEGSLLYYVNGVLQPTLTPTDTQPLMLGGISVPAGGNALILYVAQAGAAAPPQAGGSVTNTATVSGGGLNEALTAQETVLAAETPNLSITKSLSPTTVPESGSIAYTFVIQNSGNTAAVARSMYTRVIWASSRIGSSFFRIFTDRQPYAAVLFPSRRQLASRKASSSSVGVITCMAASMVSSGIPCAAA